MSGKDLGRGFSQLTFGTQMEVPCWNFSSVPCSVVLNVLCFSFNTFKMDMYLPYAIASMRIACSKKS